MKHKIPEIHNLLVSGWSRVVPAEDAQYVATATMTAAVSKDSRMNPIRECITDLKASLSRPPHYHVIVESDSCNVLDFDGTSPFGLMPQLHRILKAGAKRAGVSCLALRNTAGIHQLSTWVEPFSHTQEHVALFMWNGGSYTVSPFGSKDPFFGTNPIAYMIPTLEKPIVCDMATSEVPFLSLMTAIRAGKDLSADAGLNAVGQKTRISKEIYDIDNDGPVRLLPMGLGYKGSALMLLIEILTGALIGAKMGREATDTKFIPEEFGGWFFVWDISMFGNPETFRQRVSSLANQIRTAPRAEGLDSITLPGDRSWNAAERTMKLGEIEVSPEDLSELRALGVSE